VLSLYADASYTVYNVKMTHLMELLSEKPNTHGESIYGLREHNTRRSYSQCTDSTEGEIVASEKQ